MLDISAHIKQQRIWEQEHKLSEPLIPINSPEPSSGVVEFWNWVKGKIKDLKVTEGLEICCGKGRNAIYLVSQGVKMFGYDFSKTAIEEARKKSQEANLTNASFIVHDAIKKLPYKNDKFDFCLDVFGSTDLESKTGRQIARDEMRRVLKPGGYLFVYTLSTDDEFFRKMYTKNKAKERNAFYHPESGKFEKTWDQKELLEFYSIFKLVEKRRLKKQLNFLGKTYNSNYFWLVFQKV